MALADRSSGQPVGRHEVEAVLATRAELGPEYDAELVESFAERIEQVIEARVASARQPSQPPVASTSGPPQGRRRSPMILGFVPAWTVTANCSSAWPRSQPCVGRAVVSSGNRADHRRCPEIVQSGDVVVQLAALGLAGRSDQLARRRAWRPGTRRCDNWRQPAADLIEAAFTPARRRRPLARPAHCTSASASTMSATPCAPPPSDTGPLIDESAMTGQAVVLPSGVIVPRT